MIFNITKKSGEEVTVPFFLGSFDFHVDTAINVSTGVSPTSNTCLHCKQYSDVLMPISFLDEYFNEYPLDEALCSECTHTHIGE